MPSEWENNSSSSSAKASSSSASSLSASSSTATSPEPNLNGNNNGNNNNNNDSAKNGHGKDCALKASTMSHDPTSYVARARVTRPTPPKPSCNPMQFVQIKPCNLYQMAQQQLKKFEEIKKVKEVMKEEPEDWQNNLDSWKSSRRKRVEHIIDRVVEVKKLEQEEHDRTRRKSKTFSEMMEERGERGRGRSKLQSLASYNEDEANDLSDLGIGTSSASGKSSISEDCETHSIVSEPAEVENISSFDIENNSCQPCHDNHNRDRISSPGYETSSTAPVASPDPYEYTYEGAIEDYKSRVSKATASSVYNKPSEKPPTRNLVFNRKASSSVEEDDENVASVKKDLPKIDISKKRELFEKPEIAKKQVAPSFMQNREQSEKKQIPSEFVNVRSIKDRLSSLEKKPETTEEPPTGILSGEITSIKERLQCLEQQKQQNSVNQKPNTNKVVTEVVAVPPLKDRLSSLQNAVTKEEVVKKPVVLVDEYQLEMMKNEELARRQLDTSKDESVEKAPSDDSGINTTDEKIDQEPATTEDEDDADEQEQKQKQMIKPQLQSHEEKLKNLNTPTVVSLVDKPIVVDVGGGNTLFNSSKVVRNDEDGEVNHAQNLLKMFKMAFDGDETVEDVNVVTPNVVVDRSKAENESAKLEEPRVPWRRVVNESSESVVKASKIPQGKDISVKSPGVDRSSENIKKSIVQSSKIPQGLPKVQVSPMKVEVKKVEDNSEISCETAPEDPSETIPKGSVFSKVTSFEQIVHEALPNDSSRHSQASNSVHGSVGLEKAPPKLSKVDESQTSSTKVDQNISKVSQNQPTSPSPSKKFEMGSNLILNIDNSQSQKKSMIPVPSKGQPVNQKIDAKSPSSPGAAVVSPNPSLESPSSPSVVCPGSPSVAAVSPSSPSPPVATPRNSGTSVATPSNPSPPVATPGSPTPSVSSPTSPKLGLVVPKSPVSPQKLQNHSPIYENLPSKINVAGAPIASGRVEIFNSKSMPPKPKSPEVLPRTIKTSPVQDLKSNIQTEDFLKSARSDFFKDLELCQPKIVAEQTKRTTKTAMVVEHPNQEPVTPSNADEKPKLAAPLCAGEQTKQTDPVAPSTVVVGHANESQIEKSNVDSKNTSSDSKVDKPQNIEKITKSDASAQSPSGAAIQSKDALPFEDCVDILQSFLAAERSYPDSLSEGSLTKKANSGASEGFLHQETVVEVPCKKLDVKDLPDPNFIRTPCIDVDCGEKLIKDSIKTPQAQLRDSTSSAGDSSPSSEITVIFKPSVNPSPGSPTPNKSSLLQIANRVNSPIANRRDPLARQKPVHEKPCLKLDVKDLPDPNFIRTPCIEVERKALSECNSSRPTSPLTPSSPVELLAKTNVEVLRQTCHELSSSPPLSPVLGSSPSEEKPNFLIARVEVVETKIKVTTTNDGDSSPPPVPASPPPAVLPGSPKMKPKSAQNSKPKNIFEFLKKNFQSKPEGAEAAGVSSEAFQPISVDNSKFYIPSDVISKENSPPESQANNGVNIEITKTITTDEIVEQADSEVNFTDEINEILDEEISKLVVEDAKP